MTEKRSSVSRTLPIIYGAALILALMWPGWLGPPDRTMAYLKNLAHYPLFAVLVIILLRQMGPSASTRTRWKIMLCVTVAIIVLEYLQVLVGRSASYSDMALGGAGALAGLAVMRLCYTKKPVHLLLIGTLTIVVTLPLVAIAWDGLRVRDAFPLLGSFEDELELTRWDANDCRVSLVREYATEGRRALKIDAEGEEGVYHGVFLVHGPRDWSSAVTLDIDIAVPSCADHALWFRLDDHDEEPSYHDRGQVLVPMTSNVQSLSIPLGLFSETPMGRSLEMTNITRVGIFWDNNSCGDIIYIDNVRLKPRVVLMGGQ